MALFCFNRDEFFNMLIRQH